MYANQFDEYATMTAVVSPPEASQQRVALSVPAARQLIGAYYNTEALASVSKDPAVLVEDDSGGWTRWRIVRVTHVTTLGASETLEPHVESFPHELAPLFEGDEPPTVETVDYEATVTAGADLGEDPELGDTSGATTSDSADSPLGSTSDDVGPDGALRFDEADTTLTEELSVLGEYLAGLEADVTTEDTEASGTTEESEATKESEASKESGATEATRQVRRRGRRGRQR